MNFYDEYKKFSENYKLMEDQNYVEAKENNYFKEAEFDEFYKMNLFFEKFYDDDETFEKEYDLSYCMIKDFPDDIINSLIEANLNTRSICYKHHLHIELVKYIYRIWNDQDNYSFNILTKLKNHLIETATMDKEEYYDILKNPNNKLYYPNRNYIYYSWWLYCFYPLLENGEELILKLIDFVYLEDAQDMLMYGIYQMDCNKLYSFFKKFVLALHKQKQSMEQKPCFYLFETGTGAFGQFDRIKNKLHENGYNILDDPDLQEIYKFTDRNGNEQDYREYF